MNHYAAGNEQHWRSCRREVTARVSAWRMALVLVAMAMAAGGGGAVDPGTTIDTTIHISTGQQLADEVTAWGRRGDITLLVLTVPVLSINASTQYPDPLPLITAPPQPGNPFSSGHLIIQSASSGNRTVLDAGMRWGLVPYMRGNAHLTLQDLVFINLCDIETGFSVPVAGSPVPRRVSYTSGLNTMIFNRAKSFQSHTLTGSRQYGRQADLAMNLYVLAMMRSQSPLHDAAHFEYDMLSNFGAVVRLTTAHSVVLDKLNHPSELAINVELMSLRDPADPLLQQLRAEGRLMPPQYCNGSALPPQVVSGDVDPAEGPLWFADDTPTFLHGLSGAAALTAGLVGSQGALPLPPVVFLSGNASLDNTPRELWYPLLLSGPYNDNPAYTVTAVLDLSNRDGVLVLQAPGGKLAIEALTMTGLLARPVPNSNGGSGDISSAFPLAAIQVVNSSSSTASSSGNSTSLGSWWWSLPVWLRNVTLVLPAADFLALAALTRPASVQHACLDAPTAQLAAYLQTGVTQLSPAAGGGLSPASESAPPQLLLASMLGWGLNGTQLQLVPDAAVSDSVLTCLTNSTAQEEQQGASGLSTAQIVGVVTGAVAGALLLGALLFAALRRRSKRPLLGDKQGSAKAAAGLLVVQQEACCADVVVVLPEHPAPSLLVQAVRRATEQHDAVLGSAQLLSARASADAPDLPQPQPQRQVASASESGTQKSLTASSASEGGSSGGGSSSGSSSVVPSCLPKQQVQQLATTLDRRNADKVVVLGVLGQGGSGTVYTGVWRGLQVALKSVVIPSGKALQRAVMEAAISASVGHRNVVATYQYDLLALTSAHTGEGPGELQVEMGPAAAAAAAADEEEEPHWSCGTKLLLVQELCACPLSSALDDGLLHDPTTRAADLFAVLSVLLDIASGLAYLHDKDIVHGDLKPANVLLKLDPAAPAQVVAKLADFGLSVHMPMGRTHVSQFAAGTPFYVAPEVVVQHRVSRASDMFSLGVLMWEVFTGHQPCQSPGGGDEGLRWHPLFPQFEAPNEPPQAFVYITHRCLQREAPQRPTAAQVVQVLQQLWQAHRPR